MAEKKQNGKKTIDDTMMYAIGLWITGFKVAAVDGDVDREEVATHIGMLRAIATETKSGLLRSAAGLITSDHTKVGDAYMGAKQNDLEFLEQISSLLKSESDADRNRYLYALLAIAGAVGSASGGGWLGGNKFSADEARMGAMIHAVVSDMQDIDELRAWIEKHGG
jgi:hypothetical protein